MTRATVDWNLSPKKPGVPVLSSTSTKYPVSTMVIVGSKVVCNASISVVIRGDSSLISAGGDSSGVGGGVDGSGGA